LITVRISIPDKKYKAYLFDCDGTLVDSMPLHYEAWNYGIHAAGVSQDMPEEYFYQSAGKSLSCVLQDLKENFGWVLDAQTVDHHKEKYFAENSGTLVAFPDVLEHLLHAKKMSIPIAVASGSARSTVYHALRAVGLEDLPDAVVSIDDVQNGKPAPDTFLRAAHLLQVEPSACLVFEDSIAGIEAAQVCGMDYVLVDAQRPR